MSTDCIKDQLGRQTGEVTLNYSGKGGTGAYYFYGNATGAALKHGDSYTVVLIDSDSCYVIEKGIVNCPPFTCAQSNLKVSAAYECVDTLLKARLRLDVSGFLGNITFKGDKDGDLLDQGSSYKVQVTDEAGCTSEATGSIVCKFDSCAYSRPALDVSYICLHDSIGNTTGLAELVINGSSKAGGVSYIGNQPGQILRHLDSYQVTLKDAFGCSVIREGIINCVPLSSSDPQILTTLRLVPNPNFGEFEVKMNSGVQEEVNFSICTPEGRIIQTESRQIAIGENRMSFNLSGIPRGIYYVKMDAHALKATLKWVKL
ncbi:MAG: T9SS type A sorting domain-containing protein [Saprospiraceae bacterium]